MEQYFEINELGEIIGTEFFYKEEVPNNFKRGWVDEIFFEPIWSFNKNCWEEGKDREGISEFTKQQKSNELSILCQKAILGGFIYEMNGVNYHFSYDQEAQKNFSDRWNLFQNDMISSIKVTAHDENDKDVRLSFNKDEFNKLYLTSIQHKEHCISKYRDDLMPLVEQAYNNEQLESITWDTVVVKPVPSLVVVEDDNTLDKQVEEMKVAQAEGDLELLMLMYSMGVLG